jgi:hypothetical protein
MAKERIRGWIGWYRFARTKLGYGHEEAVVFANLRHVEDQNREALRRRAA